ncbi:MAG: LysR substrate-binding domain-containing protein [Pseudomonas sp.]|uniref:LysR family transcriptional regulator n=1 Tax=Pseudomonas sp. TaxID=306 RepID=UPI00339B936A
MTRRFDHLGDIEAFLAAVEKGSLSAAAVALATTASVLSRAITRLEARLGTQLLRRTTRRLSLTDAGQLYLEQARTAFSLIEAAERQIQGQEGQLSGRVRLSVPTTYGHYRLPALLAHFTLEYPRIRLDVSISNRNVDLVDEGVDLAIRLGALPDSGLVGRRLEDAPLCLVAAPAYLARAGMPGDLAALAEHACLPFVMPSTGKVAPWLFGEGEQAVQWLPGGAVQVFDDVLATVSLAEAGLGICQTYEFIVAERIRQGRLVRVLPQLEGGSRPFSILYAPHRQLSAAARRLIDFMLTQTSARTGGE